MSGLDPADPLFRPLTLAEATAITGRSRRTIDRWIKDGRLRTVKLGWPPETVLIEGEVVETEKECRDARARGRPPKSGPSAA